MRILATSCPNQDHFYPIVPTLWAMRNAGHDVLVALPDRFARLAAAAGLPAVSVAGDSYLDDPGRKKANQGATVPDLIDHIIDYYVPATENTIERTVKLAEAWEPDLVMCTDWEYSAPIAAARLGVPTVLHGWGMLAHPETTRPIARALLPIHQKCGLPDGVPGHWRMIDNCPAGLQSTKPPINAIPSRYAVFNGSAVVPRWLCEEPAASRVLVTLGDVPIMDGHVNVLQRTVAALLKFDVDVVIAADGHLKLEQLGELPSYYRLVNGLPISDVLPTCTVAVTHGGAGTVMSCLVAGIPQLCLPQTCVQYQHADRIAEVGAGLALHPGEATVEAITAAVSTLLDDPSPRDVLRTLRADNARRPRPDTTAQLLEADFMADHCTAHLATTTSTPTRTSATT